MSRNREDHKEAQQEAPQTATKVVCSIYTLINPSHRSKYEPALDWPRVESR